MSTGNVYPNFIFKMFSLHSEDLRSLSLMISEKFQLKKKSRKNEILFIFVQLDI